MVSPLVGTESPDDLNNVGINPKLKRIPQTGCQGQRNLVAPRLLLSQHRYQSRVLPTCQLCNRTQKLISDVRLHHCQSVRSGASFRSFVMHIAFKHTEIATPNHRWEIAPRCPFRPVMQLSRSHVTFSSWRSCVALPIVVDAPPYWLPPTPSSQSSAVMGLSTMNASSITVPSMVIAWPLPLASMVTSWNGSNSRICSVSVTIRSAPAGIWSICSTSWPSTSMNAARLIRPKRLRVKLPWFVMRLPVRPSRCRTRGKTGRICRDDLHGRRPCRHKPHPYHHP